MNLHLLLCESLQLALKIHLYRLFLLLVAQNHPSQRVFFFCVECNALRVHRNNQSVDSFPLSKGSVNTREYQTLLFLLWNFVLTCGNSTSLFGLNLTRSHDRFLNKHNTSHLAFSFYLLLSKDTNIEKLRSGQKLQSGLTFGRQFSRCPISALCDKSFGCILLFGL